MFWIDPPPDIPSTAFWTALPATIAAIGAILATLLSHRNSTKQRKAVAKESTNQINDQNVKLDDIQEAANGTLIAAMKRIDDLEALVTELRKGRT